MLVVGPLGPLLPVRTGKIRRYPPLGIGARAQSAFA